MVADTNGKASIDINVNATDPELTPAERAFVIRQAEKDAYAAVGTTPTLEAFREEAKTNRNAILSHSAADELKRATGCEYEIYPSRLFAAGDFQVEYLVEDCLVAGQPAVVAGPSKSMKTSLSVDLGISLASGHAFLDHFSVSRASRVLFLSAESGLGTLQETARRVCDAKMLDLASMDRMHWGAWVPRAKSEDQLALLRYELHRSKAEVVIIDPVYMVVDGDDAANVAKMGQQLKAISDQCLHQGATPVLVHHARKNTLNAAAFEPLELSDLAGAGMTEFFRQWMLLNRRERYQPGEPHRMNFSTGGSAGHSTLWALDIAEGSIHDDGGRRWELSLTGWGDAMDASRNCKEAAKEGRRTQKAAEDKQAAIESIATLFRTYPEPKTRTKIRESNGKTGTPFNAAFEELRLRGVLESAPVVASNSQTYDGYSFCEAQYRQWFEF